MQALPGSCVACGATLPQAVGHCPFCGWAQAMPAASSPATGASTDPDPATAMPPTPAPVPAPTAPAADPPRAAPAPPRPGSVPPVPPRPSWSLSPPAQAPSLAPTRAPTRPQIPRRVRQRPPPRPRTPTQARARALARRQLLLAGAILAGSAVAWRLLTAGPHGDVVVTLPPAAADAAGAPDGTVLVDGILSGPAGTPIRLPPGRHVIGLAADAWTTPAVTIRLHAGETRRVPLHPVPHHAELSLDTMPSGAALELHGAQYGAQYGAPSSRRLGRAPTDVALPPGTYRLAASLPGYQPLDQTLVLRPGEHRVLDLALVPDPLRTLHLLAPPAGSWSAQLTLGAGDRFALVFQGRIRVRAAGQVMLLDGDRSDLGTLDGGILQLSAVGDAPVAVELLVRRAGPPG